METSLSRIPGRIHPIMLRNPAILDCRVEMKPKETSNPVSSGFEVSFGQACDGRVPTHVLIHTQ